MLNKFFKTIHNKYSKFFRFIFFLRYLFAIFFISIAIFLIIPNFFNYDKKIEIIKKNLFNNYELEIRQYKNIQFNSWPLPNIELKDVLINFNTDNNKLNVKSLKLFPKIFSIYNFDDFQINKIIIAESNVILKNSSFKSFIEKIFKGKKKQSLHNLNIQIVDESIPVILIENVDYTNFGYKKDLITGRLFDKSFKIDIKNNLQKINFNLLGSGLTAEIDFGKKTNSGLTSGIFKSKILNSNLKFNFVSDTKRFKIYDTYFRNKNLSFTNEGVLIFHPFLDINLKFILEDINTSLIKNINLHNLLKSKNFLKKINMKNEIDFKSRKFSNNFINELNLKTELAYGRINYIKKSIIFENFFECSGNINLLEEYPLLFFDCLMTIDNKKKLNKKLSIKKDYEISDLSINIVGNLNILNNKIIFKKVTSNNKKASREDLQYFKTNFESILFDESFFEIFNFKKIKKFILEIS